MSGHKISFHQCTFFLVVRGAVAKVFCILCTLSDSVNNNGLKDIIMI